MSENGRRDLGAKAMKEWSVGRLGEGPLFNQKQTLKS